MDLQQRTRWFGIRVILCACILRLLCSGLPGMLQRRLTDADNLPFLKYLETGRNVRFSLSSDKVWDHCRESPVPNLPEKPLPQFAAEDAESVELYRACGLQPDLEQLLEQPLQWNLAGPVPTVLILHTHTTESYTKQGEGYEETSAYRTLDEGYNMLSVGDTVAEILEQKGIGVIHDRQLHDYPSYNGSYVHSRSGVEKALEENPGILLVLDLHRDASESGGRQLRTEVVSDGEVMAQLMMVVGTNASGQRHESWEENLALALKLHVQLQRQVPGIMRPLNLRAQRFNQDLSPGMLLVEVGAAGNTHAEALAAARELAEAIAALADGSDNYSCITEEIQYIDE